MSLPQQFYIAVSAWLYTIASGLHFLKVLLKVKQKGYRL